MEEDHDRIADERLQEADSVERASKDLKREIRDTRDDWESKKGQEQVPGAVDPDKFYPEQQEEREQPEPEYQELNPQTADASGGGQDDSDDEDDE